MPSRARLDEFIAVVESGDHAGAIELLHRRRNHAGERSPAAGRPRYAGRPRARRAGADVARRFEMRVVVVFHDPTKVTDGVV